MATSGAPRTAAATTISSSSPSYASVAAAAAVRGASGTLPDPNAHKTGPDRILIPISQVGRRSVTLSSDSASTRSILSDESTSSSVASVDLPAFRSVQRSHFFQFCATVVFLFVLPLALLVAYKREFRSDAFAIGVAAWLASETLRQVVFDLVTPAAARHRVPAAEFENLVLDDDLRHDLTSPSHSHAHHHEDDAFEAQRPHSAAAPLPSGPGAAIPTLIYSIAQEALRLGAVAVIVRLLPTQVPLAASPLLSVAPSTEERHYIPVPPPSHPRAGDPGRPSHGSLPPLDPLFWSALWLALGWAGAEILWGSRRLWTQLELYRDVLPLYPEEDDDEARRRLLHRGEREVLLGVPTADPEHGYYGATADGGPARATAGAGQEQSANWHSSRDDWHSKALRSPAAEFDSRDGQDADDAEEEEEEDDEDGDFEYRVREAQRDELEEQLGVPLYEVPVGIIFIWRLDSLLLSLVFTLFLALPFRLSPPSLFHFPLYPTFALVAITHALLSYAWVARVRKVGIPSISYASLIVLVALTFAALGSWGVLV
ncbi:hypothetical protein JCM3774_005735 [Rhodotorula dairenensis]